MGVPVVTLAGAVHISRVGLSLLSNMELKNLIAQTPQDYVCITVGLAADLKRLNTMRKTLRGRMQASPVMDAASFVRGVESAYREMWRNKKPPPT
jgi:predicted O-linked N-acetylglucosamine transferase (SPINDLY family)